MTSTKQHGATAIEYALVLLLIAIVTLAAQRTIGSNAFNALRSTANLVDNANQPLQ